MQAVAACQQSGQQKQESGGHPDVHLEEQGPEVSPGDGDHELPQHLHGAGEKADSGAQHEQRAVKALSRTDGREPEEHHRDQIRQYHGDAEALRNLLFCLESYHRWYHVRRENARPAAEGITECATLHDKKEYIAARSL